MIHPSSVFVGRPIFSSPTAQHARSMLNLVALQGIGAMYDHVGESSVSTARDYVAHYFKTRTTCDWLVWIDADIDFTMEDWEYLMEERDNELAVCAEYMKKTQDLSPEVANFGLGFARIHRSVYELLDQLVREDGEPRLLRYRAGVSNPGEARSIEEFVEYHPIGVHPDGSRRNEDHGFWLMVRLADIQIRKETRTRLGHTGSFTWRYDAERLEAYRKKHGGQ